MAKERSREPVQEQKGPVRMNEPTYKWETFPYRDMSRAAEVAGVRSGQTMTYHEPKK